MKINVFVPTRSGGRFADAFPHSSISGIQTEGPENPGDEIIQAVDESRMSLEKVIAQRFIQFLGNRRLTVTVLKTLSIEEQDRLKKEFLEG